jgi:hypothetical protein
VARRSRLATSTAGVAAVLLGASLAVAAPAGATRPATTSHFSTPSGIASIGPWIAVANHETSTLTILAASGGSVVRTVSHSLLGIAAPTAIVAEPVSGRRTAFVAGVGGHVAELTFTAKGASVDVARTRILRPTGCAARSMAALTLDARGHLIEACSNGEVTEWLAKTGDVVRAIAPGSTHLTDATGIAILGANAYLTNAASKAPGTVDSVTELSLASGARLRVVTNTTSASYAFSFPSAIASDGKDLWEANQAGNTVDELAGASLKLLGTSGTNLTAPAVVLATPKYVWVSSASVNGSSSMVTQFYVVNGQIESPWMMCNSNGPYQFGNPSGFTMHGGMLWVANASDNLIDQMNGLSGALAGTYT